jgi:hypothetical protein
MQEDEKCLGLPIEKPGDQHSALVWHQGQRLFCKNGGEYISDEFVQCCNIAMVSRPCTPNLDCHIRTAFLIASNLLLKLCNLLYSLAVWLAYPEVSPSDQLSISKYYQNPVSVSSSHSALHGLSFSLIDMTVTEF